MEIAEELLLLADALAHPNEFEQASLRRAVSTAYYAVFHLLTAHGAQRWNGTASDRVQVERKFNHGNMKTVSEQYKTDKTKPQSIRTIAKLFVGLQEKRLDADYDSSVVWTRIATENVVTGAVDFFEEFYKIQATPEFGTYLLAMLLGKQR